MEPTRRASHLTIAVPASFTSDIPHIREKTSRVGIIARAAATFRVEEIIIYHDLAGQDQRTEEAFAATLLRYIETPQYLRKLLFPTSPLLQYAGVLPPLRTPHHPLERHSNRITVGEFREGVVVARRSGGVAIEIGVEQPAILPQRLPNGMRVTVQVVRVSDGNIRVRLADLSEISIYWGYRVRDSNPTLGEITGKGFFDLVVLTSRMGKPLTEAVGDIKARWRGAQNVLIVFGSPREGLDKILSREGLKTDSVGEFDVNTIPLQGVESVRTEEAVWATLAALSIIIVD